MDAKDMVIYLLCFPRWRLETWNTSLTAKILDSPDHPWLLKNLTGCKLKSSMWRTLLIQPEWSRFIRARTKCTGNGKRRLACQTGSCKTGNPYYKDLPPLSPVTLVVFLKGFGHDRDRYALNLTLSFNVPVSVQPLRTLHCSMGACMWILSVRRSWGCWERDGRWPS